MKQPQPHLRRSALVLATLLASTALHAADWSDTSIGWHTGNKFAEPKGTNDITKQIFNFTYSSGSKSGSDFFNVDLLQSDSKDPAAIVNGTGTGSAQEAYVIYRHTFDIPAMKFSGVRGGGIVAGFDWNAKTDAGYNSKKRMLVVGPKFSLDVPGFLDVGVFGLWESNAPSGWSSFTGSTYSKSRYSYDLHPVIDASWGIPVSAVNNLSFEGYANFIASKGKDEFGGSTAAETHIEGWLMYDIGANMGHKGIRAGVGYQYWKNKFGNPTTASSANGAGPGATAKTPMLKIDYHF